MPGTATATADDRALLLGLQRQALRYFLDNSTRGGLILDRQRNHGPRRRGGWCSTSATGMGLIAVALASAPPYRLLCRCEAVERVRLALETARDRLPHDHGVLPHFVDGASGAAHGADARSTVDTAWLLAGALWAAAFLRDRTLARLAAELYDRVGWRYWADGPLLRHGSGPDGRRLGCTWDRLNGETVFLYVLAAGAAGGRGLGPDTAAAWRSFPATVAGYRFDHADLGLFVFQYGLDLLDCGQWRAAGREDLCADAAAAAAANYQACRELAERFRTYEHYWGLSAGDGPGAAGEALAYRPYAPSGPVDGTAHLTATLASVARQPELVFENLRRAEAETRFRLRGRYGLSGVNVDAGWVGPDMVGIDAGAAVLALDNYLCHGRVRAVFHGLQCVQRGLEVLGFRRAERLAA